MKLPSIGDTITTEAGLELCRYFDFRHLSERIKVQPENYKPWTFDGCSGLPDEVMGFFTGCDWRDITYRCCLPHDMGYAYGTPGDNRERALVDKQFHLDLIFKGGMKIWGADVFFYMVRRFGGERFGLSFSWAFAQREIESG